MISFHPKQISSIKILIMMIYSLKKQIPIKILMCKQKIKLNLKTIIHIIKIRKMILDNNSSKVRTYKTIFNFKRNIILKIIRISINFLFLMSLDCKQKQIKTIKTPLSKIKKLNLQDYIYETKIHYGKINLNQINLILLFEVLAKVN